MISVVVRHRAEADAAEAKAWYAREKEDLGERFVREFSRIVEKIAEFPDRFPEIAPGIRRALFQRFPYAAYYIRRQDVAVVVAVLHLHRRPGAWNERTSREMNGRGHP